MELIERASRGGKWIIVALLQNWITHVVIVTAITAWAVAKGVAAHIPTTYLVVAAVLIIAGLTHLVILVDAWRRSTSIQYRLQSNGYPFSFNSEKKGKNIVITEGAALIPLANTSGNPIQFRFSDIRIVIDGKTNEEMYGATEKECYTLPANTAVNFVTKLIQLGAHAPGYLGGIVEFELCYGRRPKRLRYKLKRKYRIHIYIADNGSVNTSGGELEVSIPVEEPAE